ncbi:HAD-IA family hydrolase [Steroidobacter cummioxidans]|uniref:HAD-IA family hydrolase n=1 Tax=Steroidobacter cummioxidans TaxID=1803913 RepID=UPI000E3186C1|nr:HAD-IA family hydrolase [Steroidobacter cummioxidans]
MTQFDALFGGRSFAAILFDMDGTLLSSIEAAERVWTRWAAQFGIDARTFLHDIHGRRAVDSVRRLNIPGIDPEAEANAITLAEIEDVEGVHAIPGAREFVSKLPQDRWAIVTSAPRALAVRRLAAAGLATPSVFITAEDIPRGKPDPACYQLAARQLGWSADDCVVFEDAAAGIRAGEASGAPVVVITATHQHPMDTHHPSYLDYNNLKATVRPDGRLQIGLHSTRKI